MRFIEREIEFLDYIAGSEAPLRPSNFSHVFSLHPKTVSTVLTRLQNKGLVERENGHIVPGEVTASGKFQKALLCP